jgi:hypothetical protein
MAGNGPGQSQQLAGVFLFHFKFAKEPVAFVAIKPVAFVAIKEVLRSPFHMSLLPCSLQGYAVTHVDQRVLLRWRCQRRSPSDRK